MVGERRREIGLLRAVGAKRRFIFNLFLTESAILGLGGALAGVILGTLFIFVFKSWLITALQIPMLIPTLPRLIAIVAACLALALALSLPALLYPAIRASRLDPALAMREV
jgi:ABC-type antimicrobial peptide transport system permease subunit